MSLMLNGIEAMRDNGGERIIKSQLREDGHLLISVTDSGVSLPPEKAHQIFSAFLRPNLKVPVWEGNYTFPSWNRTVGECGRPRTLDEARPFTLRCESESLPPHDFIPKPTVLALTMIPVCEHPMLLRNV